MSFLIPQGSGGSFVNQTGRLQNPRTDAQKRAAAGTSGNKSVIVYGVVTSATIPSATLIDPQIVTPSTTGTVQLNYNAGDAVPVVATTVENPLLQTFYQYDSVVLERRDDKYVVIGGTNRLGTTLAAVVDVTENEVSDTPPFTQSDRNQLVRVDTSSEQINIAAPYNGSSLNADDLRVGEEFGVLMTTGTDPVRIIGNPLAAGGSGQVDFTWKNGNVSSDLTLSVVGDFVRLAYMGFTSGGGGVDHWLVVSDERTIGHSPAFISEVSSNHSAVPGEIIRADVASGSITVSLPEDAEADAEVAVILTNESDTTSVSITATGTGASIVAGRIPVVSGVTVNLFVEGDYIKLKHIGGNDWHVIDAVVRPHSADLLQSTSSGQSIGASSSTKLQWATESHVGMTADLTNHRATARRAGRYQVSGFLNFPTMTDGTFAQLVIRRTGSNNVFQQLYSQTSLRCNISFPVSLGVGDYIELNAFHTDAAGARSTATGTPSALSVTELL